MGNAMRRIILACEGVPPELGPAAAIDITEEFARRQWHQNVRCQWDRTRLLLYTENDWDGDAKALIDEFSDAISACIQGGFEGGIKIVAIDKATGQK
jgi:hypothetical protein